jgi:hypothetical protein
MRIPCTCGCGLQVTYTTKINHLNGRGKTYLRARVLEENESLKPSTSQQQVLLRVHPKKKRSHLSSDQIGNRKRLKVAQHKVDQIPGVSLQEDADPMGSLSVRNEESDILPTQAYRESESPPAPVPNEVPEFPIQMHIDTMESPPVSAPNQGPEFPIQTHTDSSDLLPTPVLNQVPETSSVQSSPTLVPNQIPDYLPFSQTDAGAEELLQVPASEPNSGIGDGSADALSSARRSNRIAERTRNVTEQRWGKSHLRDEIPRSNCGGGGYRSEDEEDTIDMTMTGDEDREDEDREDEDREDEDREDEDREDEDREDEDDNNLFAESDVAGISAWDLLGEGFEREVSTKGMFFAQ